VNALRVIRERGTRLQHAIADGDNRVEALAPEDLEVLGNRTAHIDAEAFHAAPGQGMKPLCWLASGAESLHSALAEMAKQGLSHLRARTVLGGGKEHAQER